MSFFTLYGKEIFALAVPIFTLIINKFFKSSAKLSFGELHQFTYLISEPLLNDKKEQVSEKQTVHTQSYLFKNEGREPATSVEIIFNYPPMYLNVWPSRPYVLTQDMERRHIMVFDYLAPQEMIRCEVMSFNRELPSLLSVRCKEGIASQLRLIPSKVYHPLIVRFVVVLMFLGSATLVYLAIVMLQWLLLKTG